ncbi:MAG: hypothetical protein KGO22_11885, partial [Gammaproteobacteria bacterium]|nr:hypothetical protein [Gammaproteobacteria bacterium]
MMEVRRGGWLWLAGALRFAVATHDPGASAGDRIGVPSRSCAPANELQFVCGAHHPEDLARVPG